MDVGCLGPGAIWGMGPLAAATRWSLRTCSYGCGAFPASGVLHSGCTVFMPGVLVSIGPHIAVSIDALMGSFAGREEEAAESHAERIEWHKGQSLLRTIRIFDS